MHSVANAFEPRFKSKGEQRCAKVFEKVLRTWKAIEGVTYEVPIGFQRAVDFKVGNLLIEFHPIDLRREFLGSGTLKAIHQGLLHSPKPVKKKVMKALVDEMEHQYEKRRKQLISSSLLPEIRNCELICCFSASDVYHKVVLRLDSRVTQRQFNEMWR